MKKEYEIVFYKKSDGTSLIKTFLDQLPVKLKTKAYGALTLLEDYGNEIREPYSKHIRNGLFELRISFSSDTIRIFYFFDTDRKIVVISGYIKKDDKLKNSLVKSALQMMQQYRLKKKGEVHE